MSKRNPTEKERAIAEIKAAAPALPEMMRPVMKDYPMTGAELLLLNKKTVAGQKIDPDTIYTVRLPEWRPVNHVDEMIKVYTSRYEQGKHEEALQAVANYIINIKRQYAKENGNKRAA